MERELIEDQAVGPSATTSRKAAAATASGSGASEPVSNRSGARQTGSVPRGQILIVEDEPAIAESLNYALSRAGYATCVAASLGQATASLVGKDLVLLDLMLPDGSGSQLVEQIRHRRLSTAIVVLSSRDSEGDRIHALDSGADDYVTKPFSPREVVARVGAVLRRRGTLQPAARAGGLYLESTARTARCGKAELALTRVEFDLLHTLWEQPACVHTRVSLIERVWGQGFAITDRTVDSHIKSLRRKLSEAGASPQAIETVRGVGFRLRAEAHAHPR